MKKFIFLFFIGLLNSALFAQQGNFWTLVNESSIEKNLFANSQRPPAYKIFQLNFDVAFKSAMTQAPSEKIVSVSLSAFIISFPMPDGRVEQFRVVNAPVMDPALAARYPGINSFAGQGIEDPSSTIRFDVSRHGMNAIILSAKRPTIYIDQLDGNYYRIVSRKDIIDYPNHFRCLTDDTPVPSTERTNSIENADDGKLRTYRLAMLSGAEFSNHFIPVALPTLADSIAAVLAAQNSHITRANAVYERDFGIRMVLVATNDLIIYFNPATDPIASPSNPSGTSVQNAINANIGSTNYDIGHTESKGSDNGNAGCIGCVCIAGKGRGWTVYSNPSLLEFFVIDYLTHEMGHQFGANHTFSHSLEGTGVNVEPGSGVTIMGYAGITGPTDVAPHSIDIFSVKSIEQITGYIKTGAGAGCDVETITGNTAPTVSAGSDFTIPRSTPFMLTGTASDPDAGDVLSYNWEQIDDRSGAFSTFPSASATDGPMFRTYLSYTVPERTFPSLQYILTGANGFQWEVLPSVSRPLNFRFITRDNHAGAGNNKTDDMIVTVDGTTGPFQVTAPNTAITWTGGASEIVTWNVAGTTGAPVNCSNVNILFSSDGGNTFSMLLANTPNDGTQTVTSPLLATGTARIKVQSVGNIFFDISNTNFTVTPPPNSFDFSSPVPTIIACPAGLSMNITLGTIQIGAFVTPINLTATGNPAGTTVSFSPNPVNPGSPTVVTLNNSNILGAGSYTITVTGTAGAVVKTRDITYTITASAGPAITAHPVNQTICVGGNTSFFVTSSSATSFQWQLSTDGGGSYIDILNGGVYSNATTATLSITGAIIGMNNNRYRCIASTQCGSTTSNAGIITVNTLPSITLEPVNSTICAGSNTSFVSAATGTGVGYQWQLSIDGGGSYNNLSNGGVYSGVTTPTLTITSATGPMNNYRYRCVAAGSCTPPAISSGAILTVRQLPTITLSAAPLTSLLPGQTTTLTASPGASIGGTLSVTWVHGSNVITNIGNTRLINVDSIGGYQVFIQESFTSPTLVCENQSAVVTISAVPSNKLFIFPSPNDGRFTVTYYNSGGTSTKRKIAIFDSKGAMVYNREFSIVGPYTLLSINMENANRGIYYVMVADASGSKLVDGRVHVR